MSITCLLIAGLHLLMCFQPATGGALQLTVNNFDKVVESTELVLVNFYADWCRFSNMLEPIWDEGADLVAKKLDPKRVLMAKVDCDSQDKLSSRFHISKYPTLKLIRNGHVAKKEYRGQRSAESFLKFLQEEIRDPIKVINSTDELHEEKKGQVIGYFESPNSYAYQSFMKMAMALKDECVIIAGFGSEFRPFMPGGEDIVIVRKPSSMDDIAVPAEVRLTDTAAVTDWVHRRCVPLVREITFENAEELTEEGLPFLILFHLPDDIETPKRFLRVVEKDLHTEKDGIQFLTADGLTFAHPLQHLGKSKKDLPLIAIDSFRHMYVFPDIKDMENPLKMKQFIDDLHSGKLHREFHYGPQPSERAPAPTHDQPTTPTPTAPPESVFKKLGPSGSRYSLLKDEL